jgi:RNA polymerase sigma-70 factor (ECF subfamily)
MHSFAKPHPPSSLGHLAGSIMTHTGRAGADGERPLFSPDFERLWIDSERRLRRMIEWRMNERLTAKVSPDDILQRAAVQAARKFDKLAESKLEPFTWLYQVVQDELIEVCRENTMEKRDVNREVRAPSGSAEHASLGLIAQFSSPSKKAIRQELQEEIRQALEQLRDEDREILCMRFFDDLLPAEIAAIKGQTANSISTAITRAKNKLRPLLLKLR